MSKENDVMRPWIAIAGAAALVACVEQPTATTAAVAASADPLVAVNAVARANYAASRTELLGRARPAIVLAFDDATLLRAGAAAVTETFNPPLYHRYKQVGHVPLGVWATLAPWTGAANDAGWREPLSTLLTRTEAARASLDTAGFPADRLARQQAIVDRSISFMRNTLERRSIEAASLRAFARAIVGPLVANADDAAAVQVDALHAVVSRWRGQLSAEEWRRLHVLVLGSKMPRVDNVGTQYFQRLLGPAELERRILYTEGIFEADAALRVFGTIVVDRALAVDFFGDPMRMDRDFLGDGARKRLDQLFGPAKR